MPFLTALFKGPNKIARVSALIRKSFPNLNFNKDLPQTIFFFAICFFYHWNEDTVGQNYEVIWQKVKLLVKKHIN